MRRCVECDGTKKLVDRTTDAWSEAFDYHDKNSPDHLTTRKRADADVEREGNAKYVDCPYCKSA
ncbi:hypothetical protein ACFQWC_14345 [Rossellomorea sp. GCM10028870]|uniref:hypothetical protein n=1 Tax=Rossellomorea sp. GCM10028870 TaxID=3273426 RepID=UPI003617A7F7